MSKRARILHTTRRKALFRDKHGCCHICGWIYSYRRELGVWSILSRWRWAAWTVMSSNWSPGSHEYATGGKQRRICRIFGRAKRREAKHVGEAVAQANPWLAKI